jgi:hypothetical protein
MSTPRYTPNAYYVLDELTGDAARRIVSGPFKTSWAAELDRRELNIAGDCCVVIFRGERFERSSLIQATREGTFA